MAELPEETTPAVIVVKPERPIPSPRSPNGRAVAQKSNYDPKMMYYLELATILTLRDQGTIEALGERLATVLQAFIRDATNLHSLALSRIVFYLFNLLRLSHVRKPCPIRSR
jgi:brefeldin A-resistance guanine nucleotide exchange factor 1